MTIEFWTLTAAFIAGLWWFGLASGWKTRRECVAVRARRNRNGEGKRLPGGGSQDSPGPWR